MIIKRLRTDNETYKKIRVMAATKGITMQKAVKDLADNSPMWQGVEKVEQQNKKFRFPY